MAKQVRGREPAATAVKAESSAPRSLREVIGHGEVPARLSPVTSFTEPTLHVTSPGSGHRRTGLRDTEGKYRLPRSTSAIHVNTQVYHGTGRRQSQQDMLFGTRSSLQKLEISRCWPERDFRLGYVMHVRRIGLADCPEVRYPRLLHRELHEESQSAQEYN